MEFSNVIKERYSVRKYKPDMIWDDELNRILEAGMVAPTGCNYQPYYLHGSWPCRSVVYHPLVPQKPRQH